MNPPDNRNVNVLQAALSSRTIKEYNLTLNQFLDYCTRRQININLLDHFDAVLVDYEQSKPDREVNVHCSKVICALKHYIPPLKHFLRYTQR